MWRFSYMFPLRLRPHVSFFPKPARRELHQVSTWNTIETHQKKHPWFQKGWDPFKQKKTSLPFLAASNFTVGGPVAFWDSQTSDQWELRCKTLKVALWPTILGLLAGCPDCWHVFFFFGGNGKPTIISLNWTCYIEDKLPLGIFRNNTWNFLELRNQLRILVLNSLANVGAMMA